MLNDFGWKRTKSYKDKYFKFKHTRNQSISLKCLENSSKTQVVQTETAMNEPFHKISVLIIYVYYLYKKYF